jgi:NitT/TauT family transport system substrate-binding protein
LGDEISIQFTRFSAFYSPLIATIAGGFLKEEGLQPKHSVAPAGKSAIEGLLNGTVHVCQSAPSQGFGPLEKGQAPPAVHFAQINEKDGFSWGTLKGRKVLVDHGGQPLAMFKYACHRRGLDYAAIGPCAFSSLAATREWLRTDMARRFMRAYRKARAWIVATPAAKIAEAEAPFSPEIERAVLTATLAYYQRLGCWTPHVEITRPAFEVALDVFQHSRLITKRHRYEDVVAAPPDAV